MFKGDSSRMVRRRVEPLDDSPQLGGLFSVGQELSLDDELHVSTIAA